VVFFGRRISWSFAGEAVDDEGVEINHLHMAVEGVDDGLPRNALRQRGDGGEEGPFRHLASVDVMGE